MSLINYIESLEPWGDMLRIICFLETKFRFEKTYQLVCWDWLKFDWADMSPWSEYGKEVTLWASLPFCFGVYELGVVKIPRMPASGKWRFFFAWNPLRNPTNIRIHITRRYLFDSSSVQRTSGLKDNDGHGKLNRWWIAIRVITACWSLWAVI